jgi:hypothetical protein
VQIPVRQHYLPITRRGALTASAHRGWAMLRQHIKSNERLRKWAKALRSTIVKLTGKAAKVKG